MWLPEIDRGAGYFVADFPAEEMQSVYGPKPSMLRTVAISVESYRIP